MNIELVVDGVTMHVQFQNANGLGCLTSSMPIPGTGYGRRREVAREDLQILAYGWESVMRADPVDLRDGNAAAIARTAPINNGDVLRMSKG